jgi:hypothetical protein
MVVIILLDESQLNCTPIVVFKDYVKVEYSITKDNHDLIETCLFLTPIG